MGKNMINIDDLKNSARGRWYGILTSIGISEEYLTKKHTGCPMCRNGKDRFRWINENGDGTWFCNQCSPQAGDGIALIQKTLGLTFPETIKRISELIGGVGQ